MLVQINDSLTYITFYSLILENSILYAFRN